MTETQRLKELEKIAEQLGIGQNREVECVSCHNNVMLRKAILLTNKGIISYLCPECNEKLIKGQLTKQQIDQNEILKQIKALQKDAIKRDIDKTPYVPDIPRYPFEKYTPDVWIDTTGPYTIPYRTGDITYDVYENVCNSSENTNKIMLLKLEPKYDRTSAI